MKKVMFALCLVFGGFGVVSAQEDTTSTSPQNETHPQDAQSQDQDRERIQSTDLPDAVKRSLEGQEYRGWLVNGAYKAKGVSDMSSTESDTTSADANREEDTKAMGAQGEEIYIVELKNGAETKTVRFDKIGKKIEGMKEGEDQNDQSNPNDQKDQSNPNDQSKSDHQKDHSKSNDTKDKDDQK